MAGQQKILVKLLLLFSSLLFKSFSKLLIKISFMPVTLKSHTERITNKKSTPNHKTNVPVISFNLYIVFVSHLSSYMVSRRQASYPGQYLLQYFWWFIVSIFLHIPDLLFQYSIYQSLYLA